MSSLTEEQKNIIHSKERNIFINAVPGSGKTFITIKKIISDIEEIMNKEKLKSYNDVMGFVVITYTNEAAKQLKDKLNEGGIKLNEKFNHIGTIDSFVKKNILKFKNRIINFYNKKNNDNQVFFERNVAVEISYENFSSPPKEGGISINETLLNNKDLIFYWITVFSKDKIYSINKIQYMVFLYLYNYNKIFFAYINSNYKYFYIDEIQDINFFQSLLIKSFFRCDSKVFMVGDENQQLYRFNGADFKYVKQIVEEKSVVNFKLTRSFRNSEDISKFSNSILNRNKMESLNDIKIIKYELMISILKSIRKWDDIFVLAHWNTDKNPELEDIFENLDRDAFVLSKDIFSHLEIKDANFINYFKKLLLYWYQTSQKREGEDLDWLIKNDFFKNIDEYIFSQKMFSYESIKPLLKYLYKKCIDDAIRESLVKFNVNEIDSLLKKDSYKSFFVNINKNKLMTIHKSKGLECKTVFIYLDDQKLYFKNDETLKNTLYVSATRAREEVYFVFKNEVSIENFKNKFYKNI